MYVFHCKYHYQQILNFQSDVFLFAVTKQHKHIHVCLTPK
jgi:hypothetical protein